MAQFNKVILIGNLTRDVEVRTSSGGTTFGKFGLAINETYTRGGERKQKTIFVDVTAFGKNAENLGKYFSKGSPIFIEGRLDFSQWENQAGEKRSKVGVIVDRWQFMDSKKGNDETVTTGEADYSDTPF